MRFLANENVPLAVVVAVRDAGHDVVWVRLVAPGISDDEVLERARAEDRVLLTFDKDFGALVFQKGAAASPGVILFRVPAMTPAALGRFVVRALSSRDNWRGHYPTEMEWRAAILIRNRIEALRRSSFTR